MPHYYHMKKSPGEMATHYGKMRCEDMIELGWEVKDIAAESYFDGYHSRDEEVEKLKKENAQLAICQWTSVEDRLPKDDGELVLVSDGTCCVTANYYHVGKRFHFHHPHLKQITHWMSLPKLPENT